MMYLQQIKTRHRRYFLRELRWTLCVQLPSDDQWNKFLLNRLRPDLNRSQGSLPQAVRITGNPALLHCCERAYAAVVTQALIC